MFLHKKIPLFCRICHTPLIKNTANPPLSHITQKNGGLDSAQNQIDSARKNALKYPSGKLNANHRFPVAVWDAAGLRRDAADLPRRKENGFFMFCPYV